MASTQTDEVIVPEMTEIYLTGLGAPNTVASVAGYFSIFGPIVSCDVYISPATLLPKGYGYINFCQGQDAVRSLMFSKHFVDGVMIAAKPSDPSKRRCTQSDDATMSNRKLFVEGIPKATTKERIEEFYSKFGKLESVTLFNKTNAKGCIFGFVVFEDSEVSKSLVRMKNINLDGAVLNMRKALTKKEANEPRRMETDDTKPSSSDEDRYTRTRSSQNPEILSKISILPRHVKVPPFLQPDFYQAYNSAQQWFPNQPGEYVDYNALVCNFPPPLLPSVETDLPYHVNTASCAEPLEQPHTPHNLQHPHETQPPQTPRRQDEYACSGGLCQEKRYDHYQDEDSKLLESLRFLDEESCHEDEFYADDKSYAGEEFARRPAHYQENYQPKKTRGQPQSKRYQKSKQSFKEQSGPSYLNQHTGERPLERERMPVTKRQPDWNQPRVKNFDGPY